MMASVRQQPQLRDLRARGVQQEQHKDVLSERERTLLRGRGPPGSISDSQALQKLTEEVRAKSRHCAGGAVGMQSKFTRRVALWPLQAVPGDVPMHAGHDPRGWGRLGRAG